MPGNPEDQFPGLMKISETGAVTVELFDNSGGRGGIQNWWSTVTPSLADEESQRVKRICGRVLDGGPVTLDACDYRGARVTTGGPGPVDSSTSIVHPVTLVGAEYSEQEEILFTEFGFSVEGLDTWLSVSGIERELETEEATGITTRFIRYRRLDDIVVRLPNGDSLEFRFNISSSSPIPVTEVTVKQTASVFVRTRVPRPISYFASIAHRLCNFLTLALDQNVCIEVMTGYLARDVKPENERKRPIKVYGGFAPWIDRKPNIRWDRALFLYPAIADRIDDVLYKWFDRYDEFSPALDLYFASRTQSSVFLEAKILWLAQALETLHSRSSSATELPKAKFDNQLLQIEQSNLDETVRTWLLEILHNRVTFRKRLRGLLYPFRTSFGTRKQRERFIDRVNDTRNYLTHYDEETTSSRAKTPEQLIALHEKMEGLFQLHALKLLGLNQETLTSIAQESETLSNKLAGEIN